MIYALGIHRFMSKEPPKKFQLLHIFLPFCQIVNTQNPTVDCKGLRKGTSINDFRFQGRQGVQQSPRTSDVVKVKILGHGRYLGKKWQKKSDVIYGRSLSVVTYHRLQIAGDLAGVSPPELNYVFRKENIKRNRQCNQLLWAPLPRYETLYVYNSVIS